MKDASYCGDDKTFVFKIDEEKFSDIWVVNRWIRRILNIRKTCGERNFKNDGKMILTKEGKSNYQRSWEWGRGWNIWGIQSWFEYLEIP